MPLPRGAKLNYHHVIITRFSVRIDHMNTAKKGTLLSEERLDHRMKLFRLFCLPSILRQKNKKFHWILMIDPELPEKYHTQLQTISRNFRFIKLLVWDREHHKLPNIGWIRKCNIPIKGINHLIMTRLDDDDALHPDFTTQVLKFYWLRSRTLKGLLFMTFPKGVAWVKKGVIGQMSPMNSNFIALGMTLVVDPRKYPVNVYAFNHAKIRLAFTRRFRGDGYIYKRIGKIIKRPVTQRNFHLKNIFLSIKTPNYMFIYCIHDYNDGNYKSCFRNARWGGAKIANILKSFALNPQAIKQFIVNFKKMQPKQSDGVHVNIRSEIEDDTEIEGEQEVESEVFLDGELNGALVEPEGV